MTDAEKLSGQKFNLSSYADIVKAIHVVQTQMGITGTTAKEASETISGSLSMLKSAWTNLVTGLGDENANFDQLIGNVVDSAVTAGNNLIPRIQQVLFGVATLVEKLAPVIADKLPQLMEQILPPLLNAASSLVEAVVKSLPSIIKVLVDALPPIIEMLVTTLAEMSPELVELAVLLMVALANGLAAAIPVLVEKAPEIIMSLLDALVRNAPRLMDAGMKLLAALGQGIGAGAAYAVGAVLQIGSTIAEAIGNLVKNAWNWGKDMMLNLWEGLKAFITYPIRAVKDLVSNIFSLIHFSEPDEGPLSNFHTYAPDMMKLFAQGITDNKKLVTDAVNDAFDFGPVNDPRNGGSGGATFSVPRTNSSSVEAATMEIDRVVFARLIFKLYNEEAKRVGVNIAGVNN